MLPRGDTLRPAPRVSAERKLEPSEPLSRLEFPRYGNSLLALVLTSACIIPDTGIEARGEAVNPGPVRLVQATALPMAADTACRELAFPDLASCPLVPDTLPFGFIDIDLCVCPGTLVDNRALNYFDIYVEDPDADGDGNPIDSIFGAFLLDLPLPADDPTSFVAYETLLSPTTPATPVQFGIGSYGDAIERPEPLVRRWTIGDADRRVDLCNENASSPDPKLAPGLHSLRLVATDRPWYRPFVYDSHGEPKLDEDEQPIRVPPEEAAVGVPDTPGGASYAIADYVFLCGDGAAVDVEPVCDCVEPTEGTP